MLFSSTVFLMVFLPITLALYFVVPGRPAKNVLLLIVSLIFYAWGEPVYIFLMIGSILINWIAALVIEKAHAQSMSKRARATLVIALVANLLVLGFFKYEVFLATNLNTLLGTAIPSLELALPVGISFYTLQAVSYLIDVYRRSTPAQSNLLYFGTYIAMFPHLLEGPIVRYQTVADQICNRVETVEGFMSGLRLFIVGLAKKVLLANTVAILAAYVLEHSGAELGAFGAWAGLIAYAFQIFFDFSGYSDMAIGLGRMFGFTFLRNFNYPYISRSVSEFWRRWHISLSSFFRDYVYIPLGGSRVSKGRWVFNIAVVWSLTGFWHGAAWNFIAWGVFYGVILVCEKFFLGKILEALPRAVGHIYTIFVFLIGWALFWVTDTTQLIDFLATLFGAHGFFGTLTPWEITAWTYWPVFLACVVASTPVVPWVRHKLEVRFAGADDEGWVAAPVKGSEYSPSMAISVSEGSVSPAGRIVLPLASVLADIVLIAMLVICIFSLVSGSFSPSIYAKF